MVDARETTLDQSVMGKAKRVVGSLAAADGRSMLYYLRRVRVPDRAAYNLIRGYRVVRSPAEFVRRWREGRALVRSASPSVRMGKRSGFAQLPPGTIPEVMPAIDRVRQEFAKRTDEQKESVGDPFRRVVVLPEDLLQMPEVMNLALSPNLISVAADYLGSLPVLQTVETWWSPRGQGRDESAFQGSQFYHRDRTDFSLAKFVFNVIDVTREGGPLTFLPRDVSDKVCNIVGDYRGRIPDEEIFAHIGKDEEVACEGPAGTGHVADTARCLHYGGRSKGAERLVLMISYSTRFAPLEHVMRMDCSVAVHNGDRLSERVLGLA